MKDASQNIFKGAKIEGTYFAQSQIMDGAVEPVSNSITDYQRGVQEGRQQGYEAGVREGLELGFQQSTIHVQDQFKDVLRMLNLVAASFQIKKEELLEQIKPEIIKFNINLVEKLLQHQLSKPEIFIELLETLLNQMQSHVKDMPITIYLAPEDAQMIKTCIQSVGMLSQTISQLNLMAEPSMARGNCRLETSVGMLNYDISRLLKDLEIKLLEV